MKPNYEEMTFTKLRAYAIEYRDYIEAIRTLMSRRDPNSKGFPAPTTDEEMQEQMEMIERLVNEKKTP